MRCRRAAGATWLSLVLSTAAPVAARAQAIERATVPTATDTNVSEIVVQASRSTDGYRPTDSYVATGLPADVLDTPRSISMASQQLLQDRGVVNLEQAVKTLPGVSQDNSFGGTQDSFNIRGFRVYSSTASSNPGILIDGVRGAMARGFQANTDRVELLSGPSAMLYGRTEPGGVINIVRKQPLHSPYHALEANVGSHGQYRAIGDVSGPAMRLGDGDLAYRLVLSGEKQGYWRDVGHDMHDLLVAPSLGWRTSKLQLVLAYEFNDSTAPLDRGTILINEAPVATPRQRSFSEDFSRYHSRSHFARGNLDYQATPWLILRTRAAYMNYSSGDVQVNPYRLGASGNLSRYILANRGDRQSNAYVQESAVVTFDSGAAKHVLLFGGDYRDQERHQRGQDFSGLLNGFNINNPAYGLIREADAVPTRVDGPFFINRSREWGVFGQYSLTLGPLTAAGGARLARITQFGSAQGAVNDDSRKDVVLPSASVLYKLADNASLYASYSTSYHPNASVPATPLTPATGPFQPEKGKGWELGAKAEAVHGKLLATAALFRIDKQNVLTTSNDVTSAIGGVRSQGLEVTVAGQVTPAFNLTAAYAYIDADVRDDPTLRGNRLVNVPRDKGSVFGTYEVRGGALRGFGFGLGATASSRIAVDAANSAFLPGYVTVDGLIRFRARMINGSIYRIQINAGNLLDRTYYPYSNGSYRIGVGEPRTVMLTGKIEY